jgi:dihydrofolate reductase
MIISLVAAASENNVIGKDGGIPWDLPDDFKHFHDATVGHPIIMGRRTYESIGRALPRRRNIIVTRQQDFSALGCEIAHSLTDALALVAEEPSKKICIIGGGDIYAAALPLANELDLTRVHMTVDGGTAFFPEFSQDEWVKISEKQHPADDRHAVAFTFELWRRKGHENT